jgi:hypothetical protein
MWAKKVKEKSGLKCESCQEVGVWLNACHIVGRRHRATRWGTFIDGKYDLCGFSGCFNCHKQYDEHGPQEYIIRVDVIGERRYQLIRQMAMQTVTKDQDYAQIKKWIEEA